MPPRITASFFVFWCKELVLMPIDERDELFFLLVEDAVAVEQTGLCKLVLAFAFEEFLVMVDRKICPESYMADEMHVLRGDFFHSLANGLDFHLNCSCMLLGLVQMVNHIQSCASCSQV